MGWRRFEKGRRTGIPGIDQEAYTVVNKIREEFRSVVHSVAVQGKGLVDLHVAALECQFRFGTQSSFVPGVIHPRVDPPHLTIA